MFFESLFQGSFRFADVTGFTVVACHSVYYTTFVMGMVLVLLGHWDAPDGGVGLGMGGDTRLPDQAGDGFCHASDVGEGHVTLGPVTVRVPGAGLIFYLPGAYQAHLEYPATLNTFFKCFISRSLSCGSEIMVYGIRPVCQCSDDTHLVFHRLVTLELQVLISVCRLSVYTELE